MGSRDDEFFERPKKKYDSIHKEGSFGHFIPLRDLLKKNHEDRVQDYLKMENLDNDEETMPMKKSMGGTHKNTNMARSFNTI